MAIELDEQAQDVQPEAFRQGVDPEPEQQPEEQQQEAQPEPEAQPEAPEIGPDWLYQPPPQPQQAPPQQYYQEPQYQQPAQASPPPPNTRRGLDAFIENPDAYIDSLVQDRLVQAVGPIMQQQQALFGMTDHVRRSQTRAIASQAELGIKNAYKAFNKDPDFKSNPQLQQKINSTMQTLYNQALAAAEYGNYTQLYNLANIGEREIRATIGAAKLYEGIGGGGQTPLSIMGAEVESTRAPSRETGVQLTAEQEEIARRMGGNYADKLRKAIAETEKLEDFE